MENMDAGASGSDGAGEAAGEVGGPHCGTGEDVPASSPETTLMCPPGMCRLSSLAYRPVASGGDPADSDGRDGPPGYAM